MENQHCPVSAKILKIEACNNLNDGIVPHHKNQRMNKKFARSKKMEIQITT